MKLHLIFAYCIILILALGCKKKPQDEGEWLVPKDEVRDGGPGKDGIPSVDNPNFAAASATSYLDDNDLVIGYFDGSSVARAYSHTVLDWHEIINDAVNGINFSIIYCPLTGTASCWNRNIGGKTTTFGVSGLLYNSNIIPYDRATDSNWSQILYQCVNGTSIRTVPIEINVVETTWKTWKQAYPNSQVITTNTGLDRNYGNYPYGDYKTSNSLLFSVNASNDKLHKKERVHGVIGQGNNAKVYQFNNFTNSNIIEDNFDNKNLVIIGSEAYNFIVSFENSLNGNQLSFTSINDSLPNIMRDENGTVWDLFGHAVSGPDKGKKLPATKSMMGYWFAFPAFYNSIEIYE